jgi:hypothetical protein
MAVAVDWAVAAAAGWRVIVAVGLEVHSLPVGPTHSTSASQHEAAKHRWHAADDPHDMVRSPCSGWPAARLPTKSARPSRLLAMSCC